MGLVKSLVTDEYSPESYPHMKEDCDEDTPDFCVHTNYSEIDEGVYLCDDCGTAFRKDDYELYSD